MVGHEVVEDFAHQVSEDSAHLHAATAALVLKIAALDARGGWRGVGMRSCAHWLAVAAGFDERTASEMLRVGHALASLPLVRDAFCGGQLSLDKVSALTRVATAADERTLLDVARHASAAQLASICRGIRRAMAAQQPATSRAQRNARRVSWWWRDDDGMFHLHATLPPEEGRIVLSALEAAVVRPMAAAAVAGSANGQEPDAEPEADDPHGARRADALLRVCEGWLAEAAAGVPPERAPRALTVHVDIETLAGLAAAPSSSLSPLSNPGAPDTRPNGLGRCHLEDGPALAVTAARRIGCDAQVVAVLERDGIPLYTGRMRRFPSHRLRRLLRERDGHCRYPGCTVPATDTEAHHVVNWIDGGPTTPANLVSLCRFHHHRHHDGEFRIVAAARRSAAAGSFRFETAAGLPIGPPPLDPRDAPSRGLPALRARHAGAGRTIDRTTPVARDRGARFSLDHAIWVLLGSAAAARPRAGPGP